MSTNGDGARHHGSADSQVPFGLMRTGNGGMTKHMQGMDRPGDLG